MSFEKGNGDEIERLVRASQAGDRSAFDGLVLRYQRQAMTAAVRLLGDANEAAEAVQESFLKAYLHINRLRRRGRFGVWLLRIVINQAISRRRAARHRFENIRVGDCYEDKKTMSPEAERIAKDLKEAIQRAMLKLSRKEAQAIAFFGLEDLSHNQAAEIMGCSVESVRWHVFQARKKLKVLLKDHL